MTGNTKRSIRLLSWRTLRWAITLPALPLVWWACTSHPLAQPTPAPEQQTNIYVTVAPNRQLDLVVMVDNSPSMAPKVDKMNKQFSKLIAALKDPVDGTYPDLRIALLSSDLGTGGAYDSGACGPKNGSYFGDQGKFQMIDAAKCGVTSPDAIFLEYKKGAPVNYAADKKIEDVFACLATNLGTGGCGMEHQLQAFEFGLAAQGVGTEAQQAAFLRPNAYLGLVFLSDEDDCSAATNDGLFGNKPGGMDLSNEAPSLRCYTRSHTCNGKNLTEDPGYPTTKGLSTALANCSARTDGCDNQTDGKNTTDTSVPTSCSPLKNVKSIADHIKAKKGEAATDRILVAGIFGWPLEKADGTPDMDALPYKIDMAPNPSADRDPAHPNIYDSWPICYDPNHRPAGAAFDKDAAGWGASAGLRMSAFIDEFDKNGLKFSICQPDFSKAMQVIGDELAKKLRNLCVGYKLYDTDPADGLQPSCRVVYRVPETDGDKLKWNEDPNSLPFCPDATPASLKAEGKSDCWRVTVDKNKCTIDPAGQLIEVVRPEGSSPLVSGTMVGMQCRTCTDFKAPEGSEAYNACNY